MGSPATGPPAVRVNGIGQKPVRSLPSRLLPKGRTQFLESGIGGGEAKRPGGLPLLVWVVNVVVRGVDLHRARQRVGAASVLATEPAQVHLPEIESRFAVDDPLGHRLSHAT